MSEVIEIIKELEESLGLEPGFFTNLLTQENDWSFVIKLHALFEAAITQLITNKIGFSELDSYFSRIELGNKASGKLRIAKDLELLEEEERRFISTLSEIRNSFVHDVRKANSNLDAHLLSLTREKLKNVTKTIGYTYPEKLEFGDLKVDSATFTRENPRLAIWQNAMHVLALIFHYSNIAKSIHSIRDTSVMIQKMQSLIEKHNESIAGN